MRTPTAASTCHCGGLVDAFESVGRVAAVNQGRRSDSYELPWGLSLFPEIPQASNLPRGQKSDDGEKKKSSIALELAEKQMRELERGIPSAAIIPLDAHRPSRSKWAKMTLLNCKSILRIWTQVYMSEGRLIEPSRPNVRLGKAFESSIRGPFVSDFQVRRNFLDAPPTYCARKSLELDLRTNGLNRNCVRLIGRSRGNHGRPSGATHSVTSILQILIPKPGLLCGRLTLVSAGCRTYIIR